MPYDPDVDGPYADWLKDKDVQTRPTGWTAATTDQVHEGLTTDGVRFKETLDQLGHQVVEETLPGGRERKHVRINLQ